MRLPISTLLTSLRLRGALWVMLLVVGLTAIACTNGLSLLPGTGVGSRDGDVAAGNQTIRIRLQPGTGLHTQATAPATIGNVHHFAIKLYTWAGTLGTLVHSHATSTGTVSAVAFTNVPLGTYKVTAEAFADAGETQSVTDGGPQASSNTVTIAAATAPSYSSGTSLAVALTLSPGIGDAVAVALTTVDGRTSAEAHLAPNDGLSSAALHDFTIQGPANATCAFVWIPPFNAYQLCQPINCGSTVRYGTMDSSRPPGYWVSTAPASGTNGTDWRLVPMGGFYVGKYEASHMDATTTNAGTSTIAGVQAGKVTWTNIAWDDAVAACRQIHRKADLMGDREWLALAVWSMINNVTVYGNNNNGSDVDMGSVIFTADSVVAGRALTGSGGNATSHTGAPDGVFDLNGNVSEWTRDLNRKPANANWNVRETELNQPMPTSPQFVVGLTTIGTVEQRILGLVGVPITGGTPSAAFGNDAATFPPSGAGKCHRGGAFNQGTGAGLWYVNMTTTRNDSTSNAIGFRPILRF